jgi:hypothetical protein
LGKSRAIRSVIADILWDSSLYSEIFGGFDEISVAHWQLATAISERYVSLWEGGDGWGAVTSRCDPYGAFITNYTDEAVYSLGTHSTAGQLDAGRKLGRLSNQLHPIDGAYVH